MKEIVISVIKDKEPCPLTRERRWNARAYHDGRSSSGDSRGDAIKRLWHRIELEDNRKIRLFVQP